MSDTPDPSTITVALQAVRRPPPPPPNRTGDSIAMEQLFFRCLVIVMLVAQVLGMWGGYHFLEGFAHPFPAPQPEVFVAVPDAK